MTLRISSAGVVFPSSACGSSNNHLFITVGDIYQKDLKLRSGYDLGRIHWNNNLWSILKLQREWEVSARHAIESCLFAGSPFFTSLRR